MKTLTSAIYLTSWSLVLAIVLLVQSARAQTSGQYSFQQKNAGPGFTPRNVSPQNNKAFGINSSGNLDMLSVSGSSTFAGLSDVAFSSLVTGQLPRYNSVSGDWENWTHDFLTTTAAANTYAPLASPTFTGFPSLPLGTIFAGNAGSSFGMALMSESSADTLRSTLSLASDGSVAFANINLTGDLEATGNVVAAQLQGGGQFITGLDGSNVSIGTVADARLSATVTKLGSSIDLASEVTGSLPHANIAQGGATSGQALAWNGSAWAPATIAATPGGSSGQVQYNNAGAFGGVTGLTLTTGTLSSATVTQSALGTTPAAGISLENSTAAAAGAQQVSPALELAGKGWKTTATAASQEVRFRAHVLPIQGTTAPTGTLIFSNSVAGGAFTQTAGFRSDGSMLLNVASVSTGYMYSWTNGGVMIGRLDVGAPSVYVGYTGLEDTLSLPSTGTIGFSVNARSGDFTGPDAFFRRNGAAQIQMGTDTNGNAVDQTFKAADGITGTDRSGGDLTLASGDSTGSGSSVIILSTSAAGSTGTTTRAATERVRISSAGIQLNSGPIWASGTGSPEGVVTAGIGSIYSRTDGGASTSLYVKESGTGNTGWAAK